MKKLGTIATALGAAVLTLFPAFNAQAEAIHPILNGYTGATYKYTSGLLDAVVGTGVPDGQLLGGAAVGDLERALQQPLDRPKMIVTPTNPRVGEPWVFSAVPPHSAYKYAAIPVCLEQNGEIKGKWTISTTGNVTEDFSPVAQMPGKTMCQSWLYPQGVAWMQQNNAPVKASK